MDIYSKVCLDCSRLITHSYSTSFTLGIKMFDKSLRAPIYAIYGFVRFADEIVDTFLNKDKSALLKDFWSDTFKAIEAKVSLNPVLHAFQEVVHQYKIPSDLIIAFLESMEMDLENKVYNEDTYKKYIYGSAEVVGLMCLKVFVRGDEAEYEKLKVHAIALGSAFQKVNFLRDMKSDYNERGRVYFPNVDYLNFTQCDKRKIEEDIQKDFDLAYQGIIRLPKTSRLGVFCAYRYYNNLLFKIKALPPEIVLEKRIRVSDKRKIYLLTISAFKNKFGLF